MGLKIVRKPWLVGLWVGAVVMTLLATTTAPANAAEQAGHDRVVSEVPSGITPAVNNGEVYAITKVGNTMVVGGSFTSVTSGGQTQTRNRILAFNATSGALTNFSPSVNGVVNALAPGPTPGTVYVGGGFNQVDGQNQSHVALLNLSTGQPVAGFRAAATNGTVNDLMLSGQRLYVAGNFTMSGGQVHGGLTTLSATSGDLDSYMGVDVTQRHNDTGSGAQGAVGVRDIDITPDGTRMVAVGNFKQADGLDRDQVMVVSLGATTANVTADWQTNRYKPYCYNWAFDSYMRGVSMSPDGDFFVVTTTGGGNAGTLCDSAARFETGASGQDLQPTWTNYAGGDTLWGVTVTETAVYVGGHQRWMNNSNGRDFAGAGAVPRAGLAALDIDSGQVLSWNPGRNPRGEAAYTFYATSEGLWMGSNTDWVGSYRYRRPRLAFFPLAGGEQQPSDATADLPGTAYLGGGQAGNSNILYRVNAGGSLLGAADSGPDWSADSGSTSPYRNSGSNSAGYSSGASTDSTVPSSAPNALFDSERWSPSDNPAMEWEFPVTAGTPVQVRLYFANRCSCTNDPGERSFDVAIDGQAVLDNFDIAGEVGDQVGTMRAFDITSDGAVDIDTAHVVENPLVNAIEIVRTDVPAPDPGQSVLRSIDVSESDAEPAITVDDGGIDWGAVRGSFLAGDTLFYGKADGTFNSRSFDAGSFGPEQDIDPYHDPDWANVTTGSGQTYDGVQPTLYGQMSSVRGMAYHQDRLYYTLTGSSQLYWRWFNVDSGVIGATEFTASGGRDWSDIGGIFASGDRLYFVTRSNGDLNSIAFADGVPTGSVAVVDSPSAGGNNWGGRALFLAPKADQPPPNETPTATIDVSCVERVCEFDASGSTDSDGSISSYEWNFGDGATDSGQTVQHTYESDGNYQASLTVTDDRGATDGASRSVQVSSGPAPQSEISQVAAASNYSYSSSPGVVVPGGAQPGDTLLLTASASHNTEANAPAGWSRVGSEGSSAFTTHVWSKEVTPADIGSEVEVVLPSSSKTVMTVSVYRGVDADDPIVDSASGFASQSTTHSTPDVVAGQESWVVSIWSEKGPGTPTWSIPNATTLRVDGYGTGGGSTSAVVADSDGPVSAGIVEGKTATTATQRGRSVSWSIALAAETDAPPTNVAPVADFDSSCVELVCDFDASGSADSDGSIVSYSWDFGGGSTDSGQTAQNVYASDGSYDVTLTVTDDDGATDELTTTVNVSSSPAPATDISQVDAASEYSYTSSPGVTVPASVQAGDTLLMTASASHNTQATAPAGWTAVGSDGWAPFTTHVWVKAATAGDAGSDVDVTLPASSKTVMTVTAYRGVDGTNPIVDAASATQQKTTTHSAPTVVAAQGSWVVSIWSEKGAGTPTWSVPGSVAVRTDGYGSGGGSTSAVIADSDGSVAAGTVQGQSATTDSTRARSVSWSIALAPETE